MPIDGQYAPSSSERARNQVAEYEASGGAKANTLPDTDMPVIIFTYRGKKTGTVRKTPLMRVEAGGRYALFASQGGAPTHPNWYFSLKADPHITIQDGPEPKDFVVRELDGAERDEWWARGVAAYPPYEDYQQKTTRRIPVFLAEPA